MVCDEQFLGAASPDGRYVVVRELTTSFIAETHEIRARDTESHRYVPIDYFGPGPVRVHWTDFQK